MPTWERNNSTGEQWNPWELQLMVIAPYLMGRTQMRKISQVCEGI